MAQRKTSTKACTKVSDVITVLHIAAAAFIQLSDNAGDVPEWNKGGFAYEALQRVRTLLTNLNSEIEHKSHSSSRSRSSTAKGTAKGEAN